jgi:hypothetical protein
MTALCAFESYFNLWNVTHFLPPYFLHPQIPISLLCFSVFSLDCLDGHGTERGSAHAVTCQFNNLLSHYLLAA